MTLCKNGDELFMSVGSFYTLLFVIENYLKKELGMTGEDKVNSLRIIMENVLALCQVAEHDQQTLLQNVDDKTFRDLEDSCQVHVAEKAGCQMLLTFNISDFKGYGQTSLRIVDPKTFLSDG